MVIEDPLENLIRHVERIGRFNGVKFRYSIEPYPKHKDGFFYYFSIEIKEEVGEWESFLYETDKSIEIVVRLAEKELPRIVQALGLGWVD